MAEQKPLAQGKTKAIYAVDGNEQLVRVKSLDALTAFNAARRSEIEGKSEIASRTTCNVFRYLAECGKRARRACGRATTRARFRHHEPLCARAERERI